MYCCDKSLTKPLLNNNETSVNSSSSGKSNRRRGSPGGTRSEFRLKRSKNKNNYEEFEEEEEEDVEFSSDSDLEGLRKSFGMAFRQVGLLVWKNFLFRRRHWLVTSLEIILPTLLAILMAYMRTQAGDAESSSIHLQSENNTYFPLISEKVGDL
jgi:hypothetical protein